jgi:hypothetical protein
VAPGPEHRQVELELEAEQKPLEVHPLGTSGRAMLASGVGSLSRARTLSGRQFAPFVLSLSTGRYATRFGTQGSLLLALAHYAILYARDLLGLLAMHGV